MAVTTVEAVLSQHPSNPIHDTDYLTYTNKSWAMKFAPITTFSVHSRPDSDGVWHSDLDTALSPLTAEDTARMREPAVLPNKRSWRLEMEADMENWWHSEISNPVLAAWSQFSHILQTSHTAPLSGEQISENVDSTYAAYRSGTRVPAIIGEMKRNLIKPQSWVSGRLTSAQQKLSQELRGYV